MIFNEDDIRFTELNGEHFEELCFDLLHRIGFHSLKWRQGGADQGRDVEAIFSVTNPLVPSYTETWFIECKNLAKGVPVRDLIETLIIITFGPMFFIGFVPRVNIDCPSATGTTGDQTSEINTTKGANEL
jgi:hypothetical protein